MMTLSAGLRTGLLLATMLGVAACSSKPDETAPVDNTGPVTSGIDETSAQYFATTVGDRVLFNTDSSALTALGQDTLTRQAQWLNTNVGITAVIQGHADERGTRDYNLALGERRANAAYSYLVGQGVDPARLRTVTYGKERPEAVCSNESCWSQNRRAVTVLAGGPLS